MRLLESKDTGNSRKMQGKRLLATIDGCSIELKEELKLLFHTFNQAIEMANSTMSRYRVGTRARGHEAINLQTCFADKLFSNFPEDSFYTKSGRLVLRLKGYVILFKKLNNKGMPMNIYTQTVKKLTNQEIQISLFNDNTYDEAPVLYFGYQKNTFGVYSSPRIVYIDEGKIRFSIDEVQAGYSADLFTTINNNEVKVDKANVGLKDKLRGRQAKD